MRKKTKINKKNTLINTNIHLKDFIQNLFINFLKKNYPKLKCKIISLPKEATDSKFGFCLKIEK